MGGPRLEPRFQQPGAFSICVSAPIVGGTILFHEVDLLEQPYEPLGRSLGLELSIAPLEKLLDVLPNGASQF
jgi:hypothetical protein